jgi:hypothetical protein
MPELSNNSEESLCELWDTMFITGGVRRFINQRESVKRFISQAVATAYQRGRESRQGEIDFLRHEAYGEELADDKPHKTCKYCGDEVIAPHDLDYHFSCEIIDKGVLSLADDPDDKAVLNDTLTGGDNIQER